MASLLRGGKRHLVPYLRKITTEIAAVLKKAENHRGCPSCGEPARLAVINEKAKKNLFALAAIGRGRKKNQMRPLRNRINRNQLKC